MLVAEGISLAFADSGGARFTVLDVPHFAPEPGKITAISGASGSGKSTLFYVLAGLLPPQGGVVRYDETDIYKLSETRRDSWRRTRIGFIFQDFHLVAELSPLGNATLPATFGRAPGVKDRAKRILEQLGVPAARHTIEQLSRGERQRVAIARALAFDPPMIFADEPSASLDRASTADLAGILADVAKEGRTLVVATHDPDLLERADVRFHLEHGKISKVDKVAA
jgi:putative ABC transport system ATP-binding protein